MGRLSGKSESRTAGGQGKRRTIPRRGATVQEGTGAVTQRADYSDPGGDNGADKNCLEKKNRLVYLEFGSPPSWAPCDPSAPDWGRVTGRAAFEGGRQPSNLALLVRQLRRQASGFSFWWAVGSLNGGDGNKTAVKSRIGIPEPWEWLVKSRLWWGG